MSTTLLNEVRVGYNHTFSRPLPAGTACRACRTSASGCRSIRRCRRSPRSTPTDSSTSATTSRRRSSGPASRSTTGSTWDKGKHNIQFGGELQRYTRRDPQRVPAGGTLSRSPAAPRPAPATRSPTSCSAQLSSSTRAPASTRTTWSNYGSLFFQDDFRVIDRLTLNLGVRFEPTPPWHEIDRPHRSTSRWRTTTNNVHSTVFPQAPRGETFRGDPGVPEDGTEPSTDNFGPRVGFAWDITGDGKTSLRGGGGTFYDQHRDGESGNGAVNAAPWSLRLSVDPADRARSRIPIAGGSDFDLITDATIGTQQALVPDAGADRDARRRIQDAADLQLQPHVRARSGAGHHGARGLRRIAEPQRPLRPSR